MKKFISILLKIAVMGMSAFLGFYLGFAFMGALMKGAEETAYVLTYLLEIASALLLAYNINVIVHEGGHLVFGLLTGYRFCSFRIWSIMLVRQGGKMKLRSFKLFGTGGQCLMIPPEKKETKSAVILYNLGGVIFNLVFALLCLILYITLPDIFIVTKLLELSVVFSLFGAVGNGVPLNVGGIANDGMNALHLSKNPDAAEAFRKTLLINAAQTEGCRSAEMPDEWFTLSEGADIKNIHCASLMVFAVSRYLEIGDTITAEQEITKLLNGNYNIIGLHKNLLICDLICCRLLNGDIVDLKKMLTPEMSKIMKSMRSYPQIIRTQYIIALLADKQESKAGKIREKYDRLTRNFPYRQDVKIELALMNKALEKFKSNL